MSESRTTREGFALRLPEGLLDHIRVEAAKNCRSINSEIVFQLHRAFISPHETKKGDVSAS